MHSLPRIRAGLLKHPLEQQVLVYDQRDSRVHLLDPTTGCVLDLLGQGPASFEEVTDQLAIHLDIPRDPALVTLAVAELRRIGLLDEPAEVSAALLPEVNRRDLVKKLAFTGAAALLIPTVATLTATAGYAQSSILGIVGSSCTSQTQCSSGICCGGICSNTQCGTVQACEACLTSEQCVAGTTCTNGGCGNPNKTLNGGSCTSPDGCCSNCCNNGTCVAPVAGACPPH